MNTRAASANDDMFRMLVGTHAKELQLGRNIYLARTDTDSLGFTKQWNVGNPFDRSAHYDWWVEVPPPDHTYEYPICGREPHSAPDSIPRPLYCSVSLSAVDYNNGDTVS
ncbi:hypothetical protein FHX77_001317 [Bifidobacterium commune]|uniref:Uncharacterized protein n=2 Tax=Bifidobacterium commune TaxID=1505727 RepID=A0A1C4H530_9BIFI|nr:hypothetical protein [Bifidobacterium commune]MBB2955880.1 hypothetical protein [Bifidobacterium commune]SCC80027.1 hypothetical protein GA0061077_0938 [Bifidobacterium commune]